MQLHNIMEEHVLTLVDQIFKEELFVDQNEDFFSSDQCRLDVACYVLNRIQPMYVVSGRGIAHVSSDYQEKLQREADLVALIRKGITKVQKARRPESGINTDRSHPGGPYFNIPPIVGRIFHCINFAPARGIRVSLLQDGRMINMMNSNWQNPYTIAEQTAGTYTFWPYPELASEKGQKKNFEFEVSVRESGFEELHYFFNLELEAEEQFVDYYRSEAETHVKDLYLCPINGDEEKTESD
ncbi:MAG: late competence development ComFB family protein [Spirochaetales bacterium]|nr:late competence development ComFB family protein [Spirochaetales bacterium]MCF7937918.1 late competence development ComFB family protein [Spirochaetales bacterium]